MCLNCIDGTALDAELIKNEKECTTAPLILTNCAYGIYFLDHMMVQYCQFSKILFFHTDPQNWQCLQITHTNVLAQLYEHNICILLDDKVYQLL